MFMYYLQSISMVLWLFPLFKQNKTIYSHVFIFLAFIDPIAVIYYYLFSAKSSIYYLVVHMLFIASIVPNKKKYYVILVYTILIFIYAVFINNSVIKFAFGAVNQLIIVTILASHLLEYLVKGKLNLFLVLIISYFMIGVFRSLGMALSHYPGVLTTNLGLAFQLLYAILFTFIDVDTKNFSIKKSVL